MSELGPYPAPPELRDIVRRAVDQHGLMNIDATGVGEVLVIVSQMLPDGRAFQSCTIVHTSGPHDGVDFTPLITATRAVAEGLERLAT